MRLVVFSILLVLGIGGASYAQTGNEANDWMNTSFNAELLPKVKGMIRRIDTVNSAVVIKHDAIPNLDMPAMEMTFAVADMAMLNGLIPRDRILFSADRVNDVLTVVWIEKRQ